MNTTQKYDIYKQAQKNGGPCPICNWKNGDGVRTCFYSSEVGIVSHHNTEAAIMADMTPQQRSLYLLREELVFLNEEMREKQIQQVYHDKLIYVEEMTKRYGADFIPFSDINGQSIPIEQSMAAYRAEMIKQKLATNPEFAGWIQKPWGIPVHREGYYGDILKEDRGIEYTSSGIEYTAYKCHVYEPHPFCKVGHKYFIEPYHFGCTGCTTEIKLWEHGVDPDEG